MELCAFIMCTGITLRFIYSLINPLKRRKVKSRPCVLASYHEDGCGVRGEAERFSVTSETVRRSCV